jgi:hypothetical protein
LRDHRVRRRREDQMDRAARDAAQPARVSVNEPDGPSCWPPHAGPKPWHG